MLNQGHGGRDAVHDFISTTLSFGNALKSVNCDHSVPHCWQTQAAMWPWSKDKVPQAARLQLTVSSASALSLLQHHVTHSDKPTIYSSSYVVSHFTLTRRSKANDCIHTTRMSQTRSGFGPLDRIELIIFSPIYLIR